MADSTENPETLTAAIGRLNARQTWKDAEEWTTGDDFDFCDLCGERKPLRRNSITHPEPIIAELYVEGRMGYYCKPCTEQNPYPPTNSAVAVDPASTTDAGH